MLFWLRLLFGLIRHMTTTAVVFIGLICLIQMNETHSIFKSIIATLIYTFSHLKRPFYRAKK